MEKIWIYLVLWLFGFISGAITWNQIDVRNVYKGRFKFKQKGRGNRQDSQIDFVSQKMKRKMRREERRIAREKKKS